MICSDIIVGAPCMAHSAVEGGLARLIVLPGRRRVYLFFYHIFIFFEIFWENQDIAEAGRRRVVATFSSLPTYLVLLADTLVVLEREVYVIVPISTPRIHWFPHHTFLRASHAP